MGFSEGAKTAAYQREEKAFEEGGGFVEGLFQGFVQVDVEFLGFVDVVTYSFEDYRLEEALGHDWLSGDEDLGSFVAGVGGP